MTHLAHLNYIQVQTEMTQLGLDFKSTTDQRKYLIHLSKEAKCFSYAPFSKFNVGGAAWLANGDVVLGANLELSQNLTNAIHAEQSLIVQAMQLEQEITKLAVNYPPCGFCRQSLMELANAKHIEVYFGEEQENLAGLLPLAFTPADLDQNILPPNMPNWSVEYHENLELIPEEYRQPLILNLKRSYAPRSGCPAAILLDTIDGMFVGRYFENVAFNPTISAIRFALVNVAHYGKSGVPIDNKAYIKDVWLIQADNCKIEHFLQSKEVLDSLGYVGNISVIKIPINELEPLLEYEDNNSLAYCV